MRKANGAIVRTYVPFGDGKTTLETAGPGFAWVVDTESDDRADHRPFATVIRRPEDRDWCCKLYLNDMSFYGRTRKAAVAAMLAHRKRRVN